MSASKLFWPLRAACRLSMHSSGITARALNPAPRRMQGSFFQLLADLESYGIISASTPVIVGDLAPQYTNMNPVLHGLEGGRLRCARISHLSLNSDEIHLDGAALVQAGWQYAKAMRDFSQTPWELVMSDYVSAAGYSAQNLASGVDVKIPLQAYAGKSAMIVNGSFKAPKAGLYRFSARGYAQAGRLRLKLLDASGAQLQFMAYAGSEDDTANNPILTGTADLDLAEGDVVSLGLTHGKGSTVSITAAVSATYNRLSVELIEAYE